jgi:DNA-directed RNA polymerase specialized sigma24 family protein
MSDTHAMSCDGDGRSWRECGVTGGHSAKVEWLARARRSYLTVLAARAGRPDDAEDAVQDVLMRISRDGRDRFDTPDDLVRYATVAVKNEARRLATARSAMHAELNEELAAAGGASAEEAYDQRTLVSGWLRALRREPARNRAVLWLAAAGAPHAEIAQEADQSLRIVRRLLNERREEVREAALWLSGRDGRRPSGVLGLVLLPLRQSVLALGSAASSAPALATATVIALSSATASLSMPTPTPTPPREASPARQGAPARVAAPTPGHPFLVVPAPPAPSRSRPRVVARRPVATRRVLPRPPAPPVVVPRRDQVGGVARAAAVPHVVTARSPGPSRAGQAPPRPAAPARLALCRSQGLCP